MDYINTSGCAGSPNTAHPPINELKALVNEYLNSNQINITGKTGKPIKAKRMLAVICVFSHAGYPITFFDALKFNDSVLHSTIPGIERDYGIKISRRWAKRQSSFEITNCKEYYLDHEQLSIAEQVLFNKAA